MSSVSPAAAFIHDFVGVDLPLDRVLSGLDAVAANGGIRTLVAQAWLDQDGRLQQPATASMTIGSAGATRAGDGTAGPQRRKVDPSNQVVRSVAGMSNELAPGVKVELGPRRDRMNATLLPITWCAASDLHVPAIDADLEFAAFGPSLTHVHLYGRTPLPPTMPDDSLSVEIGRASLSATRAGQLATAHVRAFLNDLSYAITLAVA